MGCCSYAAAALIWGTSPITVRNSASGASLLVISVCDALLAITRVGKPPFPRLPLKPTQFSGSSRRNHGRSCRCRSDSGAKPKLCWKVKGPSLHQPQRRSRCYQHLPHGRCHRILLDNTELLLHQVQAQDQCHQTLMAAVAFLASLVV